MKRVLPTLALIVCSSSACPSPSAAACEKAISCDPDTDENSAEEQQEIETCVANQDTFLADLRASSARACVALANAFDAQSTCNAALECDELNAPTDDTCKQEREAIAAACDAVVGTDCESRVTFSCGLGSEPP